MVLLSPELLSSHPFDRLLQDPTFSSRVCTFRIDEVHLVQDWGDSSFREVFHHIGLIHAWMPRGTVMVNLTATLLAGQETASLLKILGLSRRLLFSASVRDVQDIYRVLRHGLSGWTFPDLDWIVEGDSKTIVYCSTIALSVRLHVDYYI